MCEKFSSQQQTNKQTPLALDLNKIKIPFSQISFQHGDPNYNSYEPQCKVIYGAVLRLKPQKPRSRVTAGVARKRSILMPVKRLL